MGIVTSHWIQYITSFVMLLRFQWNLIWLGNQGWKDRSISKMQSFQQAVDAVNLVDLGFQGRPFTWSKGRGSGQHIRKWLYWSFSNFVWNQRFPTAILSLELLPKLYHLPIIFLRNSDPYLSVDCLTLFCFKPFWVEEEDCQALVLEHWYSWSDGSSPQGWIKNLSDLRSALQVLNVSKFRCLPNQIKRVEDCLKESYTNSKIPMTKLKQTEFIWISCIIDRSSTSTPICVHLGCLLETWIQHIFSPLGMPKSEAKRDFVTLLLNSLWVTDPLAVSSCLVKHFNQLFSSYVPVGRR